MNVMEKKMKDNKNKLTFTDKVFLCDGEECKLVALSEIRLFETYVNYTKTYFNGANY